MTTPEEIAKAREWLEGQEPRVKDWGDRPVYMAAYATHVTAERDAEIEQLREEIEIWKSVFPDIAPERVLPDRSLLEARLAKLEAVAEAAQGLSFGVDWNNGTHAKIHRPKLIAALAALEGEKVDG